MIARAHEFATRSALIRRALAIHQPWIEKHLGVPLADVVIFDGLKNFGQIGLDKVLEIADLKASASPERRRFRTLVAKANTPPTYPPIVGLVHSSTESLILDTLLTDRQTTFSGYEWEDCPIAMRLHYYDCTVITMNVPYHAGPDSPGEHNARLLVARRDCVAKVHSLLEDIYKRDRTPRLHTLHGPPKRIAPIEWDDLVMDTTVSTLLKGDFEAFWERQSWFRERKLPFRRGYLLHGPPGNGKTSAIRAMMSSRCLSAHTLRFFDPRVDDGDLDEVFEDAYRGRPSMVLLEDIDRAFPQTGQSASKISLQQLLNCLDGVATGEGIVVVATANDPAVLAPAILRRPGRFDRVIYFGNPDATLRLEDLRRMNSGLAPDQLRKPVEASNGFSFAQLRESYIVAGQRAFERGGEVTEDDLLFGIQTLRLGMISSACHKNQAGFLSSREPVDA